MTTTDLHRPPPNDIELLRRTLDGRLLTADDADYDAARTGWNAAFDPRPAAIALCSSTQDVVAAVRFAARREILVSVRSTGHDYAGLSTCDGGLVIDLSRMHQIQIDAQSRRARVQPGVTWGAFDAAAQEHGLATTGGTVSTVGVAGYTLGGGTGHLARRFGLSADNLLSAEVVTAEGDVVHASHDENPDLFWALRGGSGNFGIVTTFEFQLQPLGPEVTAGQIMHRLEDGAEVLRRYRDFMASAPDEVQVYAFFINLPPLEVFPDELHGTPVLDLVVTYSGPLHDADGVLQPLRAIGSPIFDGIQTQRYTELQQTFDAGMPSGLRWYSTAHHLDELTDQSIDTLLVHVRELPAPFTAVYLEPLGGAVARVPRDATAFPHRDAAYGLHIFPGWEHADADGQAMQWGRDVHAAMAPFARDGVYVNLLGPDADRADVEAAYGSNYRRLQQIKKRWDANNLFRSNQNIEPA